jgi:carbamoyltransferase
MITLGISCFYHDSAAALVVDGKIVAAAQEERFTRKKHDSSFPINAIKFCLDQNGLDYRDINYYVYYEKPFTKFVRIIETFLAFTPHGFSSFLNAMPLWLGEKLFIKSRIKGYLNSMAGSRAVRNNQILFSSHHLSHAASAFYPSPFEESAVLVMDGVGEWATTSIAIGRGTSIDIVEEIYFPHSLGLFYSAFTSFLGFKVNSGEYKLMGLAPYGTPIYTKIIKEKLISIRSDGSFALNMEYFAFATDSKMTNEEFNKIFDLEPRLPESPLTQKHLDIAASAQQVLDEIVLLIAKHIRHSLGVKNLCLAGGVALNCVSNSKILLEDIFENIWIQPAAGDAGGALGAALFAYYNLTDGKRKCDGKRDSMQGSYLGPEYTNTEVITQLTSVGAKFTILEEVDLINKTAKALEEGMAVGWFSGRMEFGPRALGARSILADPRDPQMQKTLNLKIKFRESFRPFAPSVLIDHCPSWFEISSTSPYMLLVSILKESKHLILSKESKEKIGLDKMNQMRSIIPAVTHVDYSARLQTVESETNKKYYKLIEKFYQLTGVPLVVNTSFNVRNEPIVCSPLDAFRCFMGTDLDILVIENCYLNKIDQVASKVEYYKNMELD